MPRREVDSPADDLSIEVKHSLVWGGLFSRQPLFEAAPPENFHAA